MVSTSLLRVVAHSERLSRRKTGEPLRSSGNQYGSFYPPMCASLHVTLPGGNRHLVAPAVVTINLCTAGSRGDCRVVVRVAWRDADIADRAG